MGQSMPRNIRGNQNLESAWNRLSEVRTRKLGVADVSSPFELNGDDGVLEEDLHDLQEMNAITLFLNDQTRTVTVQMREDSGPMANERQEVRTRALRKQEFA